MKLQIPFSHKGGVTAVLVITTAEVSLYRGLIKVTSLSVASSPSSSSSSQGNGIGYDPTCGALWNEEEVAIGGSDSKTHIYSIVNDYSLVEVTTISTRSPGDEMSTTLSSILMKCLYAVEMSKNLSSMLLKCLKPSHLY